MLSSVEAPKIENKTGGAQLSCSKDPPVQKILHAEVTPTSRDVLEVQGSSKDVCGELGCALFAFFPCLEE